MARGGVRRSRVKEAPGPAPSAPQPHGPPDYIERNRRAWDALAPVTAAKGRAAWSADELKWGLWDTPESELHLLEKLTPGSDIVELGCGSAAISAWLKRAGMFPVAVDISPKQLLTAERLQSEFGVRFPLINANAEQLHYDRQSFDVAVSEYGVSAWSHPERWLPEAHRLLRPGGLLIFFALSAVLMACTPEEGGHPGQRLQRDYFSSGRREFDDQGGVEFYATHGEWMRHLRMAGFTAENLIETRPPTPDSKPRYDLVSTDWASRWPSEDVWVARRT